MAEMIGSDGRKWIEKEDHHDYASKGVGGTALGIGIGALALTLLGRNGLGNILGVSSSCGEGCNVTCAQRLADTKETYNEMFGIYKSQIDADFNLYKGYRDADDAIIAKSNRDAFDLYAYSRNGFDALQSEISKLKTQLAVNDAVEPWKMKAVYDAIALEKERRECADCSIVGYTNCTFVPQYVADITPAATSTQKSTYNPLNCVNGCGCRN